MNPSWRLLAPLLLVLPAGAAEPPKVDNFGDPLPGGAVLRLGTVRLRHPRVSSLAFTVDGKLVSFGADYVVRTWDVKTGRQVAERAFEKDEIWRQRSGCLSRDGRRLAAQYRQRVRVFDVSSGAELATVPLTTLSEALLEFSPDGSVLAVADPEGPVHLCDVKTQKCRTIARLGFASVQALAFSRDGRRLALGTVDNGTFVFDAATGREILRHRVADGWALSVDFDASGDVLAILYTATGKQSFEYLHVPTGKPAEGLSAPRKLGALCAGFSPGGSLLLGGDGLRWFDPKTGAALRAGAGTAYLRPIFSPDGRLVASAGDHVIRVWDEATAKLASPAELDAANTKEIKGVAISPDGKTLLTRESVDGLIRLWDVAGRPLSVIRTQQRGGRYPIFSADGRNLFGLTANALAVARWELPGGTEAARYHFAEPKDHDYVYHFALSTDGRRLTAITQLAKEQQLVGVTAWDVATTKRLDSRQISGAGMLGYGAFSPDVRWHYFGERPRSLTDGPGFRFDLSVKGFPTQAAVSPDGRLVAQAMQEQLQDGNRYFTESRGVVVNETASGARVAILPVGKCGPLAFTPDGRGLVVTDTESITRWDLTTGKAVLRHPRPGPFVGSFGASFASSLVVAPDGDRAITGHLDTTALVWDIRVPPRPAKNLLEAELTAAWADLAGADAAKAYAAIWTLADCPGAMPFLRTRLKPAAAPDAAEVRKQIARLDEAKYAEREAAAKALRQLGSVVAPLLREALGQQPGAEQKSRLERLLAEVTSPMVPPGDRLRQLRAVAALELGGTAEAVKLIEELARGAAEDRLTESAAAAAERLRRFR